MALRPRLIPVVIVAATVLLGLKVSDIFAIGGAAKAQAPASSTATGAPVDLTKAANAARKSPTASLQPNPQAGSDTPPASPPASPPSASPPPANLQQANAAPANAQPVKPDAAPAANAAAANAPASSNPPDATPPAGDAKPVTQVADASATAPATGAKMQTKDPLLLSPAEIEVLQQLSQRRAEIDQRASELNQQQVVLQAAEKRVDDKIAKLQQLQTSIQAAVDKQKADDDTRTQSMVKIYETMKPKDAAQILSQLDMPNLLQMLTHMKESKTAPILAAMDPAKAQAITTAMLVQKPDAPAAPPAPAQQP
jgi:flagellar motility protein MotE (MotC chaperone)